VEKQLRKLSPVAHPKDHALRRLQDGNMSWSLASEDSIATASTRVEMEQDLGVLNANWVTNRKYNGDRQLTDHL